MRPGGRPSATASGSSNSSVSMPTGIPLAYSNTVAAPSSSTGSASAVASDASAGRDESDPISTAPQATRPAAVLAFIFECPGSRDFSTSASSAQPSSASAATTMQVAPANRAKPRSAGCGGYDGRASMVSDMRGPEPG